MTKTSWSTSHVSVISSENWPFYHVCVTLKNNGNRLGKRGETLREKRESNYLYERDLSNNWKRGSSSFLNASIEWSGKSQEKFWITCIKMNRNSPQDAAWFSPLSHIFDKNILRNNPSMMASDSFFPYSTGRLIFLMVIKEKEILQTTCSRDFSKKQGKRLTNNSSFYFCLFSCMQ